MTARQETGLPLSHSFADAPFNLDEPALAWVERCFASLSPRQMLSQLFNLRSAGMDPVEIARQIEFQPGSVTRIPSGTAKEEQDLIARFNAAAAVPLLVSADLEGSRMSLSGGIEMPNPLALAALDDLEATTRVSEIMAAEARAYGINWSFTPVLDINAAFRSAIVATRGFGSDVDTIERHMLAQIAAFQHAGVAATAKHWPGEGFDDRDQHLVTTINPLGLEDWEAQFGRLYRAAIGAGALSVMSAHIAFPAFVRQVQPDPGLEAFRPASINHHLNQTLLRERLGFNGLIVSDATAMAGLGSWSSRQDYLPEIIASGCDVILFSDNVEADIAYLEAALTDGRLTQDRIDDAVRRQLAMKAALGLHRPNAPLASRDVAEDRSYVARLHARIPTLVKNVQGLLPLSVAKYRRILVISGGINFPFSPVPHPFILPDLLAAEGFEITICTAETDISPANFDLILYLFGDETLLTRGRIFLDWLGITGHFGRAMQRHWHRIPTLMISFGYPYLLYDAPRAPTYVNAYCTTESMQAAVLGALLGRTDWNTRNPVDPFCGLEDAKF